MKWPWKRETEERHEEIEEKLEEHERELAEHSGQLERLEKEAGIFAPSVVTKFRQRQSHDH